MHTVTPEDEVCQVRRQRSELRGARTGRQVSPAGGSKARLREEPPPAAAVVRRVRQAHHLHRVPEPQLTSANCLSCGACCISLNEQSVFCDLSLAEAKRLDRRFVQKYVRPFPLLARFALMHDGRPVPWGAISTVSRKQRRGLLKGVTLCTCAALSGDVLHEVRCKVYDKRPSTCRRAVVPGDRSCRWLRSQIRAALENAK